MELAHSHGVPVIADAAAQNYPIAYFQANARSADLVCFGAKYLGAPHSTGFLCGRKDLVKAAVSHGFIAFQHDGGHAFGRGLKVDRQEVVAVVTAIEAWLGMNHEDRIAAYESKISAIRSAVRGLPNVRTDLVTTNQYWQVGLRIALDGGLGKPAGLVAAELDAGSPRVWVGVEDDQTLVVNVHAMNDGEEDAVAERLVQILGD